ncbi:MAG TPA: isoprenylcysteine carboxylmethyltransferase family protein [Candidatus Binataceae bacterium]|nr:isoprenylcysteine carboxylmethyltransferase family protein [Candidatus Binataceae bacterium]
MDEPPRPPENQIAVDGSTPTAVLSTPEPVRAPTFGAQAVELATFAIAVIGALSLGLGITDYLGDHLEVLAYLVAYAGFRVAQLVMTSQPSAIVDLVKVCSGPLGDLPVLLLFAASPFERTYFYATSGDIPVWVAAIGLLMGLVGFWTALVAQIQIDRAAESGQPARGPLLVRRGLFRYVRHPSYAGQSLAWMGWPLIYGAPFTAIAMLLSGALILRRQIREEELMMLERFGEQYASYTHETDRLIPGIW